MDFESALDLIVERLKTVAPVERGVPFWKDAGHNGCDLWLPDLARIAYRERNPTWDGSFTPAIAPILLPLCDAAAELCRIGVLRPGKALPTGEYAPGLAGEGFSLTASGRHWVLSRSSAFPRDPSRFMAVLKPLEPRFGSIFLQRADEAIRCYRSSTYLATCVMCGGAAESILLSVAIAKSDEEAVLREYRGASGRRKVVQQILVGVSGALKSDFETLVGLIAFWRDEAGHGIATDITEPQASMALSHLIRFAQLANAEWSRLAAPPTGAP